MTRALLTAAEWLAAGCMAVCLYLTWAGDLVPADTERPPAMAMFLLSGICLGLALWASSLRRSHDEGRGFDRARLFGGGARG